MASLRIKDLRVFAGDLGLAVTRLSQGRWKEAGDRAEEVAGITVKDPRALAIAILAEIRARAGAEWTSADEKNGKLLLVRVERKVERENAGDCAGKVTPARLRRGKSASGPSLRRSFNALSERGVYDSASVIARADRLRADLPPPPAIEPGEDLTAEEQAQWMVWVDGLARRWIGPLDAAVVASVSSCSVTQAVKILALWRALASQGMDEATRSAMAWGLVFEAEGIARAAAACYDAAREDGDSAQAHRGLQVMLETIKMRATIAGLDHRSISVKVEDSANVEAPDHLKGVGLSEAVLRQIGDMASEAISHAGESDDSA